ncbi:hypothetical protein FHY15_000496 [Xanthomonas arboricola]|uniref:hypothetical protein n=1 Tax=Xanthomonas arboricola TaxID=56448 RepID=UPI00141AF3C0|nr:hypothetical protein [Xanthomonas arboricola]NIK31400.1 hypothetical protein [Xanthomonas arboricola]
MIISKSEIAKRQIETACAVFLSGGDYLSVVTLAGAAEEILGSLLKRAGKSHMMDHLVELDKKLSGGRKFSEVSDEVNRARNALKHARDASEDLVEVAPGEADAMLVRAIANYVVLTDDATEQMVSVYKRLMALQHV